MLQVPVQHEQSSAPFLHALSTSNILRCLQIKPLAPMKKARVYANGCVLPDGKVLITGGAHKPKEFSDQFAHNQPGVTP